MGVAIARGFARLAPDVREAIAGYAAKATWPGGFTIYERGARADGVFILLRGRLVLRSRVKSGRGFVPAIVGPDETFGSEGLASSGSYATDAITDAEAETLFLGTARFRTLMREQPPHALALVSQMMGERAYLLERFRELATLSVEQRLIAALVRLSEHGTFLGASGRLELSPARYRLLCEFVGATRESVSVVLGKLAAEDLVNRNGGTVIVAPLSQLMGKLGSTWLELASHADQREHSLY